MSSTVSLRWYMYQFNVVSVGKQHLMLPHHIHTPFPLAHLRLTVMLKRQEIQHLCKCKCSLLVYLESKCPTIHKMSNMLYVVNLLQNQSPSGHWYCQWHQKFTFFFHGFPHLTQTPSQQCLPVLTKAEYVAPQGLPFSDIFTGKLCYHFPHRRQRGQLRTGCSMCFCFLWDEAICFQALMPLTSVYTLIIPDILSADLTSAFPFPHTQIVTCWLLWSIFSL